MASPAFAFGPMNNNYLSSRSVASGLTDIEIICLSYCIDTRKSYRELKHASEKPNIKSLCSPFIPSACFGLVPGRSASIQSPPDSGFDVLCPFCAYPLEKYRVVGNYNILLEGTHLHVTSTIKEDATKKGAITTTINKEDATNREKEGEMGADAKRKKDVIGNHGVAGIKIKGGNIDLQIDGVEASGRSSAPITPTDVDEMVANNNGVAGIDLEGTGDVKLSIGKINTRRGTTKEDVNDKT